MEDTTNHVKIFTDTPASRFALWSEDGQKAARAFVQPRQDYGGAGARTLAHPKKIQEMASRIYGQLTR